MLDLLGDLDSPQLHQRGAADGLLHPQLAALHAARQIDFAFARQQRNGAHFAQIHAYRIVGVNRLFGLMRSRKLFSSWTSSGWKKFASSSKGSPQRLVTFA